MSHTCVCLPTYMLAGTHLPTPDGRKAELSWVAGYVVRQFTYQKAVTQPTINEGVGVLALENMWEGLEYF